MHSMFGSSRLAFVALVLVSTNPPSLFAASDGRFGTAQAVLVDTRLGDAVGSCQLRLDTLGSSVTLGCEHRLDNALTVFLVWRSDAAATVARHRIDFGGASSPVSATRAVTRAEVAELAAGDWRLVVTTVQRPFGAAVAEGLELIFEDGFEGGVDNVCSAWSSSTPLRTCDTGLLGKCQLGEQGCSGGDWGSCVPFVAPVPEVCNGQDDDCNGLNDDGIPPTVCYSGPAGTAGVGTCQTGLSSCQRGLPGPCEGEVVPIPEICGNGMDDNCNGLPDEDC